MKTGHSFSYFLLMLRVFATLFCRDRARGEAAQAEIKTKSGNAAVDLLLADLSAQQSIRQLAENLQQRYTQLHVLINNAGLVMLRRRTTVDGLEMTFAVDYLAPFLLTNLLLDVLKASAPARIVNVSSNSHEAGYIKLDDLQAEHHYRSMRAYGQSKLAVVLFTYELARRLQGKGVTANFLHPAFVATNIWQSGMAHASHILTRIIFAFTTSPQKPAQTSLYLASSPE